MLRNVITLAIIMVFAQHLKAQNRGGWQERYAQLVNVENAETAEGEDVYEVLAYLHAHPININTATREDLEQLPFLNAQQVEEICEYLYRYAPLKTLGELSLIESLDYNRRLLLQYFVYVGEQKKNDFPSMKNIMKYGKHELAGEVQMPVSASGKEQKKYLGYDCRHWLRYDFHFSDRLRAGFVASQDAGEPFFANRNKDGYDYYSYYVLLRKVGRVKALAVGRYRVRLGMGLVMNCSFGLGKGTMLDIMGRKAVEISAHSSRSTGNFLQGAAATIQLFKTVCVTGFASLRKIDAKLTSDSTGIETVLSTGYHRTLRELERKNNAQQWLSGGNINFMSNGFHAGATALYTAFDKPLQPNTARLYRKNAPRGQRFANMSADYGYISRRLTVNGETAIDGKRELATLNTLSWQPQNELQIMLVQRFYSYRYNALFARSFSDGGHVQNESGVCLYANCSLLRNISLAGYVDYAYFPFPRYRCSAASRSFDTRLQATYNCGSISVSSLYRMRMRKEDGTEKGTLVDKNEHRMRLAFSFVQPQWHIKAQADANVVNGKRQSNGWMFSASGGWRGSWLSADGTLGYFHTDSFDSRLYVYERGLRYGFHFPSFFGEGLRCAIITKVAIGKRLSVAAKIASTFRFRNVSISRNASSETTHSTKSNIALQLIWKP